MPTRETVPTGAPCWVDLMTSDLQRARSFYGELFGWTAQEPDEELGGYFTFLSHGVPVAGGMASQPEMAVPDVWSVYLATADAQATVAAAVSVGGQVIAPAMAIRDLGAMAVVSDAGGAAIGMWQPGRHRGFELVGEPGAPSWFELLARDYDASVAFYRDVFGWRTRTVSDTADFRYTTLVVGDDDAPHAGIIDAAGFLPAGVSPHWTVYFAVDDTDVALEKITKLGGAVLVPAEDSPYGRLATAADPAGAVFKVVALAEQPPAGTAR